MASSYPYESEIAKLIGEITDLDPELGPVRMSTALQEVRNALQFDHDWVALTALCDFGIAHNFPREVVDGLAWWMATNCGPNRRHRDTKCRILSGALVPAVGSCLVERVHIVIMAEAIRRDEFADWVPQDPAHRDLLVAWVASL